MLKKLDLYIIKKYLGTFFFVIALIISIAIVFDFSEKIDDFIENEAPMSEVIFDYYMNFVPYFANLFSGLFSFIAVIFVTSKLAYDSEIIAILSSGITYKRLLRPYFISAAVICIFSWTLSNFVIPTASATKLAFENQYLKSRAKYKNKVATNIHLQIEPGVYVFMNRYTPSTDNGSRFTLEKFDQNNQLTSKLNARSIKWDREKKIWTIRGYTIRDIIDGKEYLSSGTKKDTVLAMQPSDFIFTKHQVETFNFFELDRKIEEERLRGTGNLINYQLEKHKRSSTSFSALILTIIGVSLASRKIRGGIGLHIGLGLLLSFSYIMFQQVSKVFALSGTMSAFIATWMPNVVFAFIAVILYRKAAK